jgi:antitoxin (DNA-binding transcriptional repressor) of toxin-antitoxin stability system
MLVGTYAAKSGFTALLKRAAKGERITIAKHGVPVATLQAFEGPGSRPVKDVIKDIKAFRAGRSLKGMSLRAMIAEGRR